MSDAELQADEYRRMVFKRTGYRPDELKCPREKSFMTPCIARDGCLAVAESIARRGVCVGCDEAIDGLITAEQAKAAEGAAR